MEGAVVSVAELRNIHTGIAVDVRADGRILTQQRSPVVQVDTDTSCNNGSRVSVSIGGTTATAVATVGVVECEASAAAVGKLRINVDAAESVTTAYAQAIGGADRRYRHAILSHVAATICCAYGVDCDVMQQQQQQQRVLDGIAEAEAVADEEGPLGGEERVMAEMGGTAGGGRGPAVSGFGGFGGGTRCAFPAQQLHLGHHFVFQIDVNVLVEKADGGNLVGAAALAVRSALQAVRLPHVGLHESANGITAEVDASKPFTRAVDWSLLPVLLVFLVSPSRHYVVDPTLHEEVALPQRVYVATDAAGQVAMLRCTQFPSKRGNQLLKPMAADGAPLSGPKRERAAAEEPPANGTITVPHLVGLSLADLSAVLKDATGLGLHLMGECAATTTAAPTANPAAAPA